MTEPPKLTDIDPVETQEWLESIDSVLKTHGPLRAHYLLERLIDYSRRSVESLVCARAHDLRACRGRQQRSRAVRACARRRGLLDHRG